MSSTIPAALTALVTRATTALAAESDASVHDGPPVGAVANDWVAIGYSPYGDDVSSVEGWTQEARGLGQQAREERFDVVCAIGSSSGSMDVAARRTRVFALLALLEADLRANGDLSDTVRFAELTGGTYAQEVPEDGKGVTVGVDFRISVHARV